MADFAAAFERTLSHEGGYANDPLDRGGETWRGIARAAHPDWPGWRIVDDAKQAPGFPASLERDDDLAAMVRALYRRHYWEPFFLDAVALQSIADEVYDQAVNGGPRAAALVLQRSLNLLNRNGALWPDIAADGKPGPETTTALHLACSRGDGPFLLLLLRVLRASRYVAICEAGPSQERFLRGWLRRCGLSTG